MVNSPTSSSDDSFSSLNSGSTLESFSVSPQIVIRRPIDVPVTPAPVPLVSDAIPYPRDSAVSPFRITTPVVITPVDARSTRFLLQ
uniref:BAG domain-containing protein n=1 Tax=Caenorhabditis tropicalis TaxID=1561998 RepID=A0A1I7T4G4_9PELO